MTALRRIANLIGVGNITAADDAGATQALQITEGASGTGFFARVLDKVLRVTEFGFTSLPPAGAQALMIRRGGDRSCSIVIGTSHPASRPTGLAAGDTAIYDVRGIIVKLTAAGLTIDAAGLPVVIQNTSGVHIKGNLVVDGDITGLNTSTPLALSAIRTAHNGHTHPVSGSTANATPDTV